MERFQAKDRNNQAYRLLAQVLMGVLAVALLGLSAQAKSGNNFGVEIDNFGQVDQNYYRGAQPDQRGFAQLKRLGVKTVIDLQEDGKSEESRWVREAGMQYLRLPLSSKRAAGDEKTRQFLAMVNDPQNWPVYVHCAGGRHRTGEMTAIYRITQYNWTADQAFAEMERYDWYGFGGHGPTKDYVFDFYGRYKANRITGLANHSLTPKGENRSNAEGIDIDEDDWFSGAATGKGAKNRKQ